MNRRILLLATDLEIGGTPNVVRELAIRLNDPPKVTVEVACLSLWGPVATDLADAGIHVTSLDALGQLDVAVIGRLRRLIRQREYDTVYSLLVHANAAAAVGLIGLRGVRQFQSIQTTQPRPKWHWKVQAVAQRRAEAVVVPSQSAAAVARDWAHVPAPKIVVIPNAVDVASFGRTGPSSPSPCTQGEGRGEGSEAMIEREDRSTAVRPSPYPSPWVQGEGTRDGDPPNALRVGFIGRLDPIKRVVDLVRAAAVVGERATVDIYGDGPDRAAIRREIAASGVERLVRMHGVIAGPRDVLGDLDVLVLPSDAEGFGLVLIEAMAAGVAVVGTDVAGIRDVVEDDVTGMLVPPRNPLVLAAAIVRLAEDEALWRRLVVGAAVAVKAKYDWSVVLPRYRQLLGIERESDCPIAAAPSADGALPS